MQLCGVHTAWTFNPRNSKPVECSAPLWGGRWISSKIAFWLHTCNPQLDLYTGKLKAQWLLSIYETDLLRRRADDRIDSISTNILRQLLRLSLCFSSPMSFKWAVKEFQSFEIRLTEFLNISGHFILPPKILTISYDERNLPYGKWVTLFVDTI